MRNLRVNLDENSYDIFIEKGLLNQSGEFLKKIHTGKKVFIFTDENVAQLYLERLKKSLDTAGFSVFCDILPAGEPTKAFGNMAKLYAALLAAGITRSDLIITFGGGVVGDIGGFAAATYLRGVKFVQIPTTLLAQVDSSVGGKVAADLPEGKNLAGCFWQPKMVLIDPALLETLSDSFFADGMGEVIKYGAIRDKILFSLLSALRGREEVMEKIEEIIETCCKIKAEIVARDEKDTGERMLLNFGHTIGHAIEKEYRYQTYSHGQAVAAGMFWISQIAEKKSLSPTGTAEKIRETLHRHGLSETIPFNQNALINSVTVDKKNLTGKLNVILLQEIGNAFIHPTTPEFFTPETEKTFAEKEDAGR